MDSRIDKTLVVIPAKNEQGSITAVIEDLRNHGVNNIVVVNDGSTDKTADVCRQLQVTCISHAFSLGAWRAIQTGFRYAAQQQFENVITFDADGQHKASEIQKLYAAFDEQKTDMVIGSCIERADSKRHFAWWLFRKLTGLQIKDITSGFRLYNSAAFTRLAKRDATLFDYQDLGILLLLRQQSLRFIETNVSMDERHVGESKIFGSWLKVIEYFLVTLVIGLAKNKR